MQPLILAIDKPKGPSSMAVVELVKRHLRRLQFPFDIQVKQIKIGHVGTLDPFASGLLLIGLGGATRLNDWIHAECPKTYWAQGLLGVSTPTLDLTVEPEQTDTTEYFHKNISAFDSSFLQKNLGEKFVGTLLQAPPQYSAAKFQGRALHQWAREGVHIPKAAVAREIKSLEILSYPFPRLCFRSVVSSGTYIRSLFSDMANHLGTLGALEELRREAIGCIHVKSALTGITFSEGKAQWGGEVAEVFSSWESIVSQGQNLTQLLAFPQIELDPGTAQRFYWGQTLQVSFYPPGTYWAYSAGKLLGLAEVKAENLLKGCLIFPELFRPKHQ